MSDFYLDVCAEAVTLAVIAASVLSAVCWLTEMTLGRQIGVYAGYVAAPVVVLMIAREIHASLECYGVSGSWCNPHDWLAYDRALAAALTFVTMPLLIVSETKLRRWSRNRALPTH
jgi:hypothetical protein